MSLYKTTIALIPMLALLTSCQAPPPSPPAPQASTEQKACATRCEDENARCIKQYDKIYQQCISQARKQAHLDFAAYQKSLLAFKKQSRQVKTYDNFLDLTHCKQQLFCKADRLNCYKNCGF